MSMSLRDLIKQRDSEQTKGPSSFIAALDRHLTTGPKKPRRKGYHPSDLSYSFCPRFFALVGLDLLVRQKDIDARLQRIFDNGHSLHDRYQKYTRDMGLTTTVPEIVARGKKIGRKRYAQEVRLDHKVGITGNTDDVLELDDFIEVVDYKSMNTYKFKMTMEPVDYHEKQLTIYMGMIYYLLGEKPPKPLRGRMVYEDKDCVPTTARILTRQGWKTHDLLTADDEILTYSIERDRMEWEPFRDKVVFDDVETLYRVGNKHQSFLATANHRWVVQDAEGNRSVRRTHELNSNSWVPRAAPYAAPESSLLTPYEAEVLGWLATDGYVSDGGSMTIYQSKEVGVEALSALLRHEDHTFHTYENRNGFTGEPAAIAHFALRGGLRDALAPLYRTRLDLPAILTRLNKEALEAFVRGAMGGDGSWASRGRMEQFCAVRDDKKEAFQLAALLLGIPVNLNAGKGSSYLSSRPRFRTYAPKPVPYGGQVWCPVTQNGTWVMEQDGKVCITGNSQELKEFIVPWDERHKELFDSLVRYLEIVNQAVKQNTPELAPCLCGKCETAYNVEALRKQPLTVKI